MNFQYDYDLHGSDRKPLIEAISQILDKPAVYQGAPSFSYRVGDHTVDRNGVLSYGRNIHPDLAAALVSNLQERGFVAEKIAADNPTEELTADGVSADKNILENAQNLDAPNKLTIELPDAGFTPGVRENLKKIVASKATLLRQVLEADSLPIVERDGKIAFPWFTLHGLEGEAVTYAQLVTAIAEMAKRQKRVTATEKPVDNAKFTMRLFLIRLGFIGNEYKTARKILLRNLSGNSSWKSGHRPERNENTTIPPNPSKAAPVTAQELTFPLEETDIAGYGTQEEDAGGETYGR